MLNEDYVKNTIVKEKKVDKVISMAEYKELLGENGNIHLWDMPARNACFSNSFFLCSVVNNRNDFGETFNYCEGILFPKKPYKDKGFVLIRHSWVYSNKFNCYLEVTPNIEETKAKYDFYMSDELKGEELAETIENFWEEDEDGEYSLNPQFINGEMPKGWVVDDNNNVLAIFLDNERLIYIR